MSHTYTGNCRLCGGPLKPWTLEDNVIRYFFSCYQATGHRIEPTVCEKCSTFHGEGTTFKKQVVAPVPDAPPGEPPDKPEEWWEK